MKNYSTAGSMTTILIVMCVEHTRRPCLLFILETFKVRARQGNPSNRNDY